MEIEESWGKVGCFLQKVAIFEKGLSRFWPGWISWENQCKYLLDTDLHWFFVILIPSAVVGYGI